jgi:hypothetical protein
MNKNSTVFRIKAKEKTAVDDGTLVSHGRRVFQLSEAAFHGFDCCGQRQAHCTKHSSIPS